MAWNGYKVIDMDSHIQEPPDEMFEPYIDPDYRESFDRLKAAMAENRRKGGTGAIASSRFAVMAPVVSDEALGQADSFGMVPREFILDAKEGRRNFGRPERGILPGIRREVNSDVHARLEDMDSGFIDMAVLYPTHVSSYCALNDVGFESALYRAYHRWVSDFCAQAPARLKWTLVANLRDPLESGRELKAWANKDQTLVGIYLPPNGPDNLLLDDQRLYPALPGGPRTRPPAAHPRRHGPTALPNRAPSTSGAPGSCNTASLTPGRGWLAWVRSLAGASSSGSPASERALWRPRPGGCQLSWIASMHIMSCHPAIRPISTVSLATW